MFDNHCKYRFDCRRGLCAQHESWCRGFTLLELLVVIAIIGVIAAIILVSLGSARDKGTNAAVIRQMEEYAKALELFYSDNGSYPTVLNKWDCVGEYSAFSGWADDTCWLESSPKSGTVSALDPYMGTRPEGPIITAQGGDFRGEIYSDRCDNKSGYEIQYFLKNRNVDCGIGVMVDHGGESGGWTRCHMAGGVAIPGPPHTGDVICPL